jgi:hypothetical protein
MSTRIWALTGLLLACPLAAEAQSAPSREEDVEPRVIGLAGTVHVGFSGYVDTFFASDNALPSNYIVQIDASRFVTARWAIRGGLVGSGTYGGDNDDEVREGWAAPALHVVGGPFFYFTPRSMWSAYAGAEYAAQLTRRGGASISSVIGSLGLQGAVSSRTNVFVEAGFGRSLNADDEGDRPLRLLGKIGLRLRF